MQESRLPIRSRDEASNMVLENVHASAMLHGICIRSLLDGITMTVRY